MRTLYLKGLITIEQDRDCFRTSLTSRPEICAFGQSDKEAIAQLLQTFGSEVLSEISESRKVAEFESKGLHLNLRNRIVTFEGNSITLTTIESNILELLILSSGRTVRREDLAHYFTQTSLRAHIRNLRKKLAFIGFDPMVVQTVIGVGLFWDADEFKKISTDPSVAVSEILEFGSLEVDLAGSILKYNGKTVPLSLLECKVLHYFVLNQGIVITYRKLSQLFDLRGSALTVFIFRLRNKLGENRNFIVTHCGLGYMFSPENSYGKV